ncbi:MAG: hypothetical protein HC861_01745 [Rhodospirillaceae bacterium]|nr:hypothetical protein [Rhodospirillaceae bacterium]
MHMIQMPLHYLFGFTSISPNIADRSVWIDALGTPLGIGRQLDRPSAGTSSGNWSGGQAGGGSGGCSGTGSWGSSIGGSGGSSSGGSTGGSDSGGAVVTITSCQDEIGVRPLAGAAGLLRQCFSRPLVPIGQSDKTVARGAGDRAWPMVTWS